MAKRKHYVGIPVQPALPMNPQSVVWPVGPVLVAVPPEPGFRNRKQWPAPPPPPARSRT